MSQTSSDPMSGWAAPVDPAVLERIVVVSPHLDDAVLGCGQLLAAHPGGVVVTITARTPDAYPDPVGDWDALGGFGPGDDVMAARRAEDVAALAVLGATPVWLDHDQYVYRDDLRALDPADVAPSLEEALVAAAPHRDLRAVRAGQPRPRDDPRRRHARARPAVG